MKKFAIVDHQGTVHYSYQAEEKQDFGGPWGAMEQMEVPQELWDEPNSNLIPGNVQVQTGMLKVQAPQMKQAFDENKQPLLDGEGNPILIPVFTEEPQFKTVRGLKKKK